MTTLSRAGTAQAPQSNPSPHRTLHNPATPSSSATRPTLPAYYRTKAAQSPKLLAVGDPGDPSFVDFCRHDLDVSRLNRIHRHLWLAGLPVPAKPLHQRIMIGRSIVITESVDLHLVWQEDRIYIKPLPDYITNHSVWEKVLCQDNALYEVGAGFLLSYLWLICHRSDFEVALKHRLIPAEMTWEHWVDWSKAAFERIDHEGLTGISPRYIYGELRLPRLNSIYRLCTVTTSFTTLVRGYNYGYRNYNTFITRNFAWLLTVIVYITVVLTAMQVGLGTSQLRDNKAFNRASYGFTVFSIVAPLAIIALAAIILFGLFIDNLRYALVTRVKKRQDFSDFFTTVEHKSLH